MYAHPERPPQEHHQAAFVLFVAVSVLLHLLAVAGIVYLQRHGVQGLLPEDSVLVRLIEQQQQPKPEPEPPPAPEIETPPKALEQPLQPQPPGVPQTLAPSLVEPAAPTETPIAGPMAPSAPLPLIDRAAIDAAVKAAPAKPMTRDDDLPPGGITFDTRDMVIKGYMTRLRDRVEDIWVYPKEAAQKGIYGDLRIKFVVRKDGSLGSVEVVQTSGYAELDRAAVKALKEGAPYWPLPEGWSREALVVDGRFIYSLDGYYIK